MMWLLFEGVGKFVTFFFALAIICAVMWVIVSIISTIIFARRSNIKR